jgi:ABC-type oligopeptide transport system ATPase subunit
MAILYKGELVEIGSTKEILRHPRHAYTQELIKALPIPEQIR